MGADERGLIKKVSSLLSLAQVNEVCRKVRIKETAILVEIGDHRWT